MATKGTGHLSHRRDQVEPLGIAWMDIFLKHLAIFNRNSVGAGEESKSDSYTWEVFTASTSIPFPVLDS